MWLCQRAEERHSVNGALQGYLHSLCLLCVLSLGTPHSSTSARITESLCCTLTPTLHPPFRRVYIHTHTHANTHPRACKYTRKCTHTHARTHTHAHANTHTYKYKCTQIQAITHTHTPTHSKNETPFNEFLLMFLQINSF